MLRKLSFIALFVSSVLSAAPISSEKAFTPDAYTVQRWDSGFRFPKEGWINVHLEGDPTQIGLQHGHLLATEIVHYIDALGEFYNQKSPMDGWNVKRNLAKSMFLRGFPAEQLEEMNAIAQGANDAGARVFNRQLDVVDIAVINLTNELESIDDAMAATPTGLENIHHTAHTSPQSPRNQQPRLHRAPTRCNAFAAIGPATKNGDIVFGHATMYDLLPSDFYNVWIDVTPANGHRFVMQTTPGGIQSGMDYSINDAGIMLSETTVEQTGFDATGVPLAARIRQAQQYATDLGQAADFLTQKNNGLSSTEWILADVTHHEIGLLSLGTHHSHLYRSSKNEWIEGAEGFYWSNNNSKEQDVRLETIPSLNGKPSAVASIEPDSRDPIWLNMYKKYKGKIDGDFARMMLTKPQIVLSMSADAKYTTSEMAKNLSTAAMFGPPAGEGRFPSESDTKNYPEMIPLIPNNWTQLTRLDADALPAEPKEAAVDLPDPNKSFPELPEVKKDNLKLKPVWQGTLLPKTDADLWLTTAFANYERVMEYETAFQAKHPKTPLTADEQKQQAKRVFNYYSRYEIAVRSSHDFPLSSTKQTLWDDQWFGVATGKGVLILAALKNELGTKDFLQFMNQFGKTYGGKEVTVDDFKSMLSAQTHKNWDDWFDRWTEQTGIPTDTNPVTKTSSPFTIVSFGNEPEESLIVYGTLGDGSANKESARQLQEALHQRKHNIWIEMKSDQDVTDEDLQSHHVILIGRPSTNAIAKKLAPHWPVSFTENSFKLNDKRYANMQSAVIFVTDNPMNRRYSVVEVAGLSAFATFEATMKLKTGQLPEEQADIFTPLSRDEGFFL